MNFLRIILLMALALAAGCATNKLDAKKDSSGPETVLITYRVKAGSEAEFEQTLAQAWKIYRQEHLVFAKPHTIVRDQEDGNKCRYVEMFTWVNHDAPDHAPASVQAVWAKMMALCEKRDGHGGLEGGEVQIVADPK